MKTLATMAFAASLATFAGEPPATVLFFR